MLEKMLNTLSLVKIIVGILASLWNCETWEFTQTDKNQNYIPCLFLNSGC